MRSGLRKGKQKKVKLGWHRDRKENPISASSIHVGALVGASCFTLALNRSSEKGLEIGDRTPALSVDGKSFYHSFICFVFPFSFDICVIGSGQVEKKSCSPSSLRHIVSLNLPAPPDHHHCQMSSGCRLRHHHHHHHLAGKNRTWC